MQTFRGRLFGPKLPGTGSDALAAWRADGALTVVLDGHELIAPHPTCTAGGFNAAGLRLSWDAAEGAYVLVIEDDAERSRCLATAPEAHARPLATAAGRKEQVARRFRLGWALLAAIVLLPFFALGAAYLYRDALADWVVTRIPYQQEARLGEIALAQTRLTTQLLESGPAVEAIRTIGEPLTSGSPHRYRWFVAVDPTINAFAAPGGIVVVNSGLLRAAATPEEVAGVLAHEIAHAELRHSLKVMVKGLGLRALAALALGDVSGTAVAEGVKQLAELGFSREAEREADREGLRRLVAAQIDPHGMIRFFETLEKDQKLAPPAFLSTHPATAERLAELRRELASVKGEWRSLDGPGWLTR